MPHYFLLSYSRAWPSTIASRPVKNIHRGRDRQDTPSPAIFPTNRKQKVASKARTVVDDSRICFFFRLAPTLGVHTFYFIFLIYFLFSLQAYIVIKKKEKKNRTFSPEKQLLKASEYSGLFFYSSPFFIFLSNFTRQVWTPVTHKFDLGGRLSVARKFLRVASGGISQGLAEVSRKEKQQRA